MENNPIHIAKLVMIALLASAWFVLHNSQWVVAKTITEVRKPPHSESSSAAPSQPQNLATESKLFGAGWTAPFSSQIQLVRDFRAPNSKWGSGHRGVDYVSSEGERLVAPVAGTITFSGLVAEKPVVTIKQNSLLVSFEPACSSMPVGSQLAQGQDFGSVCSLGLGIKYKSHCQPNLCLHYSVRSNLGYLSPRLFMGQLALARIRL